LINNMATIYAIPGFACTELLYQNIKLPGHKIIILSWPVPQKEFTLKDYAKQFLSQIDTREPFYLMGVSFGGMLCVELSQFVKAEKLILISSAKNSREIPVYLKMLRYFPMHLWLSENMHKKIAVLCRGIIGFPKEFVPQFKTMLNSMPMNYFHYCSTYIVNWRQKETPANVVHLHGNADRLLWYFKIKKPDYTIKEGNHAMVVFKAEEINNILAKIIGH
jgi:surfactin synthase thioesterase subunit